MKFFTTLLLLVSSLLCSDTLIHAGKYIDVINGKVISKSSIIIDENGVIKEITSGYKNSRGYEYYDLKDKTVMPGLMDMHVHFGQEYLSKAEAPVKVERIQCYSCCKACKTNIRWRFYNCSSGW